MSAIVTASWSWFCPDCVKGGDGYDWSEHAEAAAKEHDEAHGHDKADR